MTTRIAVIPDIHIPCENRKAVRAVIKYVGDTQPDRVIQLGDLMDYATPARWSKGTAEEFATRIKQENEAAKQRFFKPLRAVYDGPVQMHEGNHDLRPREYLTRYAPALAEFAEQFHIENLLDFDGHGVELLPVFNPVAPGWVTTHGHMGQASLSRIGGSTALNAAKKWDVSVLMGHCFSEDTEILTPSGWTRHEDLSVGMVVMTANRETHLLEWQCVDEVHRYRDYDELIRIKAHGVDLLVTPEHGLVRQSRADGSWSFPTAEELFGQEAEIPLAGYHDQEELPLSDDEIRFLALVMADGSVSEGGHIRIAQSDDGKGDYEETIRVLTDLGYQFSKSLRYKAGTTEHGTYRNYDAYRFGVKSPEARDLVAKYLDGPTKNPTRGLAGMSVHQMGVFLKMYVLTDGSYNKDATRSMQLCSKDKPKLDFLQELAVRTGYRSSMGGRHLTLNSRGTVRVSRESWSREPYSGVVWCVSVPNGTLVVRRNGKTAITQNTHRQGQSSSTVGFGGVEKRQLTGVEAGHLMDQRLADYLKLGTANWQTGFALMSIDKAHVRVELVPINKGRFVVDGRSWEV